MKNESAGILIVAIALWVVGFVLGGLAFAGSPDREIQYHRRACIAEFKNTDSLQVIRQDEFCASLLKRDVR